VHTYVTDRHGQIHLHGRARLGIVIDPGANRELVSLPSTKAPIELKCAQVDSALRCSMMDRSHHVPAKQSLLVDAEVRRLRLNQFEAVAVGAVAECPDPAYLDDLLGSATVIEDVNDGELLNCKWSAQDRVVD
jgi:hypothetical protein